MTLCLSVALLTSCDKDMGSMEVPFQPYVLSLGITSAGTTTYYVVTAEDLMSSETINAYAKGLEQNGRKKVAVPTVFTAPVPVIEEFNQSIHAWPLKKAGVVVSYICPLMFMDNPLWQGQPVITSSNKLRTYTTARFYSNDEILRIITQEGK